MTLTVTQYSLWIAGFAAHGLLAAVMLQDKNYRSWPSLFSLAIFEMSLTITLFFLTHNRPLYFYVFWAGAIIRAAIGLWLVFDIVKALPGIEYGPRPLAVGFVAMAVAMAIGSAWLASSGGTQTFHLAMMASSLARCISVVWGTFAITLFWGIGFCGWGWTPRPLWMAATFLVFVLVSLADAYAMSNWPMKTFPDLNTRIDEIFNFCILVVRLSWSGIMRKENRAPQGVIAFNPIPQIERGSGI